MDFRDSAIAKGSRFKRMESIDESRMDAVIKNYLDDDDDEGITVPIIFEVCPTCEGKGKFTNPSIDRNGLSFQDMRDLGSDFISDYRGGRFDKCCPTCDGMRVTPTLDEDRAKTRELQAWIALLDEESFIEEWEYEQDMERKMLGEF